MGANLAELPIWKDRSHRASSVFSSDWEVRSLIWLADSPSTWRSGPYRIYFSARGYDAWYFSETHSYRIGDTFDLLKGAQAACKNDHEGLKDPPPSRPE